MLRRLSLLSLGLLISACTAAVGGDTGVDDTGALCAAADDHLQDCLGQSGIDFDTCDAADAQAVLDSSCDDLLGQNSDGFGSAFLCGLGLKCQCAPERDALDFQIIEDDSDNFGCGGPCRSSEDGGFEGGGYHYGAPNHGVNGTYHIPINEPGLYHLRVFIPVRDGAGSANYAVNSCSGFTKVEDVNHAVTEAAWVDLGDFNLEPGAELRIGGASGLSFLADALEVERIGPSTL